MAWQAIAAEGGKFFNRKLDKNLTENWDWYARNFGEGEPPQPEETELEKLAAALGPQLQAYLSSAGEGMSDEEMRYQKLAMSQAIAQQTRAGQKAIASGRFGQPHGQAQQQLGQLYGQGQMAAGMGIGNLLLRQQALKRQDKMRKMEMAMGAASGASQNYLSRFPYEAGAWERQADRWGGSMFSDDSQDALALALYRQQQERERNRTPAPGAEKAKAE